MFGIYYSCFQVVIKCIVNDAKIFFSLPFYGKVLTRERASTVGSALALATSNSSLLGNRVIQALLSAHTAHKKKQSLHKMQIMVLVIEIVDSKEATNKQV